MAFIDWSDQLSVQNNAIDSEHKKLVEITNRLHDAMRKGEGTKVVGVILQELINYTKTHFRNEENIMRSHNYAQLEDHILQHEGFIKEVDSFNAKFKAGSVALSISLLNFLKTWLIEHIQGSDKKFGQTVLAAKK